MSGYRPQYYQIYELVPPDIFHSIREDIMWMLMDEYLLIAADAVRKRYGKMVANTYRWNGSFQYRGFRPPNCDIGAPFSQHRFGRGIDLVPIQCTAEEIRYDLKNNFRKGEDALDGRNYINRVEDNVPWLHMDRANVGPTDVIEFFKP